MWDLQSTLKELCIEYMFLASGMKLLWGGKTRGRSFISESKIFISEIKWSFFEIGQLPKSSEARFWQSRSRKKDHLIEEMEILARRKEKAQEFYYRRSKSIPEAQIYFLCCWHAMTPPHDLELFNGPSSQGNRGCFRPAKKTGLGTSRNMPSKIDGLGTSRIYSIWVIGKL